MFTMELVLIHQVTCGHIRLYHSWSAGHTHIRYTIFLKIREFLEINREEICAVV